MRRVASLALVLIFAPGCEATIKDDWFACERDGDCPPGQTCGVAGVCSRTVAHDAGVDAAPDTGVSRDAGIDAGIDAGGVDAGTDCLNPDTPCDPGRRCDPSTRRCLDLRMNGAFCDRDIECARGLCVPLAAPGIPSGTAGSALGICSSTCCLDADCPAGSLCWASGSGASLCMPNELLAAAAFGAPAAGACGGNVSCAVGECVRRVDSAYVIAERASLQCGAPHRARETCALDPLDPLHDDCVDSGDDPLCLNEGCAFQVCEMGSQCASGICLNERCRDTCGRTQDCGAHLRLDAGFCAYREITEGGASSIVPICYYAAGGLGIDGASCIVDDDCRDRTCVDATGNPAPSEPADLRCANTCCSDVQCGGSDQCRPHFIRGHWEMHCLPRPTFGPP